MAASTARANAALPELYGRLNQGGVSRGRYTCIADAAV